MPSFKLISRAGLLILIASLSLSACAADDPVEGKTDTGRDATSPDGSATSDADTPDADASADADTTDAATEDIHQPDISAEDGTTTDPDIASPDAEEPDARDPDAGEPDISEPDAGEPDPPGDTCESAIDATEGGEWTRDTTKASDSYNSPIGAENCPSGAFSGPDEVFSVSPTVDTTYKVVMTPLNSSFDPLLYVREDCSQGACIAGTVFNGPGVHETLNDLFVPGGHTYYIIADGESGSAGPYTISITVE